MTKKQKLVLGISLAMFLIPEILFGLLNTFFCGAMFAGNDSVSFSLIQTNLKNELIIISAIIETLGLLSLIILLILFFHPKKIFIKLLIIVLLLFLLILSGYLLYFILNFNPQIG